ncbi:MAG: hypothetical protein KIT72_01685 [Polyangiaceae bacterium]|nr:hypothetical protein [Polyangiaceae bacterium]MCW5789109.1 hypothetical protein [Polyangiaceae bacterium]
MVWVGRHRTSVPLAQWRDGATRTVPGAMREDAVQANPPIERRGELRRLVVWCVSAARAEYFNVDFPGSGSV